MGIIPPKDGETTRVQVHRRLNRMGDIRGALADVARQLENGEIPTERGKVLCYVLDTLGKYVEKRELETMAQRIRDIQAHKAAKRAEQAQTALAPTAPPALAVVPPAASGL